MAQKDNRHSTLFILSGLLAAALAFFVRQEPFFWDTVQLAARQGDWFYKQSFQTLLLPDEIDSGHIPAFGWYLAACWKVFGQTLSVSHLAMVPFLWLLIYQLYRLCNTLFPSLAVMGTIILLADPTLMSQMSLISPDIVLVAAFLLGLNSILHQQRSLLAMAVLLLGLVSLRGMMVAAALFIWQLYISLTSSKQSRFTVYFRLLLPYLPGGLVVLIYLLYHYQLKGWIGAHADSPWAESFAASGPASWFRQLAILGWRIGDFGRIFLLAAAGIAWWKSGWFRNKQVPQLLVLSICLGLILGVPAIISPGLAQHRYLLPPIIGVYCLFLSFLSVLPGKRFKNVLYSITIFGLISGNFWVYPNGIAQGWDASLAHKPYFEGRRQCLQFLSQEGIAFAGVGTVFPEIGPVHDRQLDGQQDGFAALNMEQQDYVYYSNIMNDFTAQAISELSANWQPVFKYDKHRVQVIIYQKK